MSGGSGDSLQASNVAAFVYSSLLLLVIVARIVRVKPKRLSTLIHTVDVKPERSRGMKVMRDTKAYNRSSMGRLTECRKVVVSWGTTVGLSQQAVHEERGRTLPRERNVFTLIMDGGLPSATPGGGCIPDIAVVRVGLFDVQRGLADSDEERGGKALCT
jgi:hypothetical protein